jgi:hypothetical protein
MPKKLFFIIFEKIYQKHLHKKNIYSTFAPAFKKRGIFSEIIQLEENNICKQCFFRSRNF